jgi:16S rRNA (cytosine967-C5)-methyltransferase
MSMRRQSAKRGPGSQSGSSAGVGRRGSGARNGGRGVRRDDGGQESLAAQALAAALRFDAPADVVMRRFFAANPQMGRGDRARVAEQVFDVLRNRRLYAHLAQSRGGPVPATLLAISAESATLELAGLSPEVRFSLPDWLYQRLSARLDAGELETLGAAMLQAAPLDLRANLLKGSRDEAIRSLRAESIECVPLPLAPCAIRVRGKPALERTAAFRDGLVEVQDAGSQLIAELVAPRRGQTVIDFCAGAGGKTLALAAALRGSGQVFACDVSSARLQRLRPRLARSGASNVQPFGIDSEADPKLARLEGRADAVLVDAPCSGTGTLRRNPDLKWRQPESAIDELIAKQRSILTAAARLVRPGGALVYATCSLLDEENDQIRRWFESSNPEWTVEPAAELLQRRGAALEPVLDQDCLRLRPDTHDVDAFYAVRWIRPR